MRRRAYLITTTLALAIASAGCGSTPTAGPNGELPGEVAEAIDKQVVRTFIVDRDHLYGTYARCEGTECRTRIAATQDSGRTWSHHDLPFSAFSPRKPRVNEIIFTITAIGRRTLRTYQWQGEQATWVSTDGGATWQRAPEDAPRVKTVPAGWKILDLGITSIGGSNSFAYVGDPMTGQIGQLEVPTTASVVLSGPDPLLPSGIWLAGRASYGLDVEVSFDGGARWQGSRLEMEDGGARTVYHLATTADASAAYMVSSVFRDQTTNPMTWVNVSNDRGRSWQEIVPTGLPTTTRVEDAEILPDGRMIVVCGLDAQERTFHVSNDGGRSFEPVVVTGYPAKGKGVFALPGGGFTAIMPTSTYVFDSPFHLSDDGLTWREVGVPQDPSGVIR